MCAGLVGWVNLAIPLNSEQEQCGISNEKIAANLQMIKKEGIKKCIQKFFHEISFNTVKIPNLVRLLLVRVSH
jgi:hypothetical protein